MIKNKKKNNPRAVGGCPFEKRKENKKDCE